MCGVEFYIDAMCASKFEPRPETTLCWCGRNFMSFCFSVNMLGLSGCREWDTNTQLSLSIQPPQHTKLYNIKHLFSMFLCGVGFRYDSKTEERPLIYGIFHTFMVSKSVSTLFWGIIIEFNVRNVRKNAAVGVGRSVNVWQTSIDRNR